MDSGVARAAIRSSFQAMPTSEFGQEVLLDESESATPGVSPLEHITTMFGTDIGLGYNGGPDFGQDFMLSAVEDAINNDPYAIGQNLGLMGPSDQSWDYGDGGGGPWGW